MGFSTVEGKRINFATIHHMGIAMWNIANQTERFTYVALYLEIFMPWVDQIL